MFCLNPFPHTTNLQQTSLKTFRQIYIYSLQMKEQLWNNVVAKGEIDHSFNSHLLQKHQKVSICGKELNYFRILPCSFTIAQRVQGEHLSLVCHASLIISSVKFQPNVIGMYFWWSSFKCIQRMEFYPQLCLLWYQKWGKITEL